VIVNSIRPFQHSRSRGAALKKILENLGSANVNRRGKTARSDPMTDVFCAKFGLRISHPIGSAGREGKLGGAQLLSTEKKAWWISRR